ncbi:MAG: endonuclease domain-containing protein [Bacteroidia bacterium]|nr:endonuclease domain-containing protein [Bacteroidia bacterium]
MPSKLKIIPYNPELKALAKELRKNMTISEVLLWNELRNKQILGYDFDRQRPIDNFIVDFYCKKLMLAIEIDGDTHIYRYDYDEDREKRLESLGVRFLRFDDREIKTNMNNVLRVIEEWIIKNKPTPSPSREGSLENEALSLKNKTISTGVKPTPSLLLMRDNLSREGSTENEVLSLKNKTLQTKIEPTPAPSREGNPEEETLYK